MKLNLTVFFLAFSTWCQSQDCDSLEVISIKYSPFTSGSLLDLHVWNHSQQPFQQPWFLLSDTSGDTLAHSPINNNPWIYGEKWYVMSAMEETFSADQVAGTLRLFTGDFDTLHCEFPGTWDLCPTVCTEFSIEFNSIGGTIASGVYDWSVADSLNTIVASGALTIDSAHEVVRDTICLWSGDYDLSFSADTSEGMFFFLMEPVQGSGVLVREFLTGFSGFDTTFSIFSPCPSPQPAGISGTPAVSGEIKVSVNEKAITVSHLAQKPVGFVEVFDLAGKQVVLMPGRNNDVHITMTGRAAGIYIVRVTSGQTVHTCKVVLH